jgi:quercetin dioxygenase-like cupin family protein
MAMREDQNIPRSGSAREPHALTGTALTFDLAAEADALKREPNWQTNGHNAKTLVKHPDFRVVLIALGAGARMPAHKADQCITIQLLAGRLRIHLPSESIELGDGALLALGQTVLHDVEAVEESVLLMSLGWTTRP